MICYKDKTFCASPNCQNVCGRKMTDAEKIGLKDWGDFPVAYGYFCDQPAYRPSEEDMTNASRL